MRSLLLVLLLANVLLFAAQFSPLRHFVTGEQENVRPSQLNAEKLRIVRDTSNRPVANSPATTGTPP